MKIHSILCLALVIVLLASPAWAGCGKWVIRENPNYDYLSDADFDQAVASSTGAAATLNSDGTTKESSEKDLAVEKAQKEEELKENAVLKEDPIPDLGGEWRVLLEMKIDGQDKQNALDLILIQTRDRLQGYGTILEGGADLPATATGSISDDSVSLIVSLVEQKKEYQLDLAFIEGGLKGIYELYESEKLAGRGNATASRLSS
ncbi:MAG: hypothetical protein M0Q47_03545 [Methanothrix sp.]|uniref:hypothetical protein n=1 Tax=Methanothrix sp. TaxID=90426 RepID=UPI00260090FE|nr:hypothetical protein [Methanothrix sp.]MCK9405474.1 hypothetical protein [Methanothrix sp.]